MTALPTRLLNVLFLILATMALSGGLHGDVVLEYATHDEQTSFMAQETWSGHGQQTLILGEDRARLDTGGTSYILRADLGKCWVVFDQRETYWEFDTPVKLNASLRSEESRETLATAKRLAAALVEVSPTDEIRTIAARPTKRWQATVVQPEYGLSKEIELWVDPEPGVGLEAYRGLRQCVEALDLLDGAWRQELAVLDGLVVETEERTESQKSQKLSTSTLVSRLEKDVDPGLYSPPEGFEQEAFRFETIFKIATPREMPAKR